MLAEWHSTTRPTWHSLPRLVLADTVGIYLGLHVRLLAPYGHTITWERLMEEMGRSCIELCRNLCREYKLDVSPEDYMENMFALYPEAFNDTPLMPGTSPGSCTISAPLFDTLGSTVGACTLSRLVNQLNCLDSHQCLVPLACTISLHVKSQDLRVQSTLLLHVVLRSMEGHQG